MYALIKNLSLVLIEGKDSKSFLQSMITCDINLIDSVYFATNQLNNKIYNIEEHTNNCIGCTRSDHKTDNISNAMIAAHLNEKGRAIGVFFVLFSKENAYYILINSDICQDMVNHLKKFVLRSKVQILLQDDLAVYLNMQEKQKLIFTIQRKQNETTKLTQSTEDAGITESLEINQWKKRIIELNIPMIYPATRGVFTSQQLELENINAVSFNKGCYIGQEIVNRTKYLAKKRYFLRKFVIDATEHVPIIGSSIMQYINSMIELCSIEQKADITDGTIIDYCEFNNENKRQYLIMASIFQK